MTPTLAFFGDLGGGEILVIGVLALLLFGSKRLPELGRAFGRAMREFKRATSGVEENLREVMREDPLGPVVRPATRQVARGGTATPVAPATSTTPPSAAVSPGVDPAMPVPPATNTGDTSSSSSLPAAENKSSSEDEIAS